jgi:quinone-modifying oxidoreductase subunit QmoA
MVAAQAEDKTILVIGGGVTGITTALEAAETGHKVTILEKYPYLGGRVARMNKYFPKLCPPTCGLEINFRRIKQNPNITVYTQAEVKEVSGEPGNYDVKVTLNPRFVNSNCTGCNKCVEVCPVDRPNDFNYGFDQNKAIYISHTMSYPAKYVIDGEVCEGTSCAKCVEACQYDAIDLEMQPQVIDLKAASIVVATGWEPYDASKLDNLGYGQYENVITNVIMERIASFNGPTQGKILRPSDGKEVQNIAFVQCAGSRDENHLPYCSAVCCMASLKQATYVREANPDADITIFYIDLRTPGRYEKFLQKIQEDEKIAFNKGKVAKVYEDPETKDLIVEAEDVMSGVKTSATVEMVVLATGMMPSTAINKLPLEIAYDENGFVAPDLTRKGIYGAGCAKRPLDVAKSIQDATGTALKSIQDVVRR